MADTGRLNSANTDFVPPEGAWYREEDKTIVVGASTRTPAAVPMAVVACMLSALLPLILFVQFSPWTNSLTTILLLVPVALLSILLSITIIVTLLGKVEVRIGKTDSTLFVGYKWLSYTQRFDWSKIRSITEIPTRYETRFRKVPYVIALVGHTRIQFGSQLTDAQRHYILRELKYLKEANR